MKTKLAMFLAFCLPAFAQFNFFTALSTWKGAAAPYVGPFDGYTATQGLWDINVRLLSSYTGNLITVRRSSDNATNSFTYVSATGKLDTNAITAWSGSDSVYITTVYDQSGGSLNFTQSDTSKQPKLINAGTFYSINGEPCMVKSSDASYLISSVTGVKNTWNIITVAKSTTASPEVGYLFEAGTEYRTFGSTVLGPSYFLAGDYTLFASSYGSVPVYIDDTSSYSYPHTISVSLQNSSTNLTMKLDTLISGSSDGLVTNSWTGLSWMNTLTNQADAARWMSGSMAFFTSIPSDQTTIMRYYTNRFATTYIP